MGSRSHTLTRGVFLSFSFFFSFLFILCRFSEGGCVHLLYILAFFPFKTKKQHESCNYSSHILIHGCLVLLLLLLVLFSSFSSSSKHSSRLVRISWVWVKWSRSLHLAVRLWAVQIMRHRLGRVMDRIIWRAVPIFYGNRVESVGVLWNVICRKQEKKAVHELYIYW